MKRADTDLMAIGLILASAVAGAGATLAATSGSHDAAPPPAPQSVHEHSHSPEPPLVLRCRLATTIVSGSRTWQSMTLESPRKRSHRATIGCSNTIVFVGTQAARARNQVAIRGPGSWRTQFQFSVNRRQSLPDPAATAPPTNAADPG